MNGKQIWGLVLITAGLTLFTIGACTKPAILSTEGDKIVDAFFVDEPSGKCIHIHISVLQDETFISNWMKVAPDSSCLRVLGEK